jgi:hypothetical protein
MPDPFDFVDLKADAMTFATWPYLISNTVTITGINAPTPVNVRGMGPTGTGSLLQGDRSLSLVSPALEFSVNGGPWVTSGTITNGQTLRVRLPMAGLATSNGGSYGGEYMATVVVGNATEIWYITPPPPVDSGGVG